MTAHEAALAFCSTPDPIQWPGAFAIVTCVAILGLLCWRIIR